MSDFWIRVKETENPVVLYGTGDAADTLFSLLSERGVEICAVFASDGFVRERTFHSFRVLSYKRAREIFGRMCIVMAFGTHERSVIENIRAIEKENEFYCPCLLSDSSGSPFDGRYYAEHKADFDYFRENLTDERSREILDAIISFRLSGNINDLLPFEEEPSESWKNLAFSSSETFVDIGAYDGDTIERFISLTRGEYSEIIGFEADRRSYLKAVKRLEGRERITLHNEILSDREEEVSFREGKGRGSSRREMGEGRKTLTLDKALEGRKPTLLKFDCEGDEERILEGGREIIGECRPSLILSVYHRIDDFWRLMRKVKEINPSYSTFLLRTAPSIPDWDIILLVK